MSDAQKRRLGDAIFDDIENNDFLNVLYDHMLYNYAVTRLHLDGIRQARNVDVKASLRFADLLSKSTHATKSDAHKMWAQEIITILLDLYPQNEDVSFYAGSVLSSVGNYRGLESVQTCYTETSLQEKAYAAFCREYLSVPAEDGKTFFIPQKSIYDRLDSPFFSYSAPTSMGKSFIMEVFIKEKVASGAKKNFARIVPTKALINEVRKDTIDGLDSLLEKKNYSVVTSASDYSLEEEHNFILVMTPERLLYLLISKPGFRLDYVFVDEAHKLTGRNGRAPFYYKIVDMLTRQEPCAPHFIFASPNIPNPEVYLRLLTDAERGDESALSSTFAPVSQFKFLVNLESRSIRVFNDHTQESIFVCKYDSEDVSVVGLINALIHGDDRPPLERKRNLVYFSSKAAAVSAAREYAIDKPIVDDSDLDALAKDIREHVHGEYYLADLVQKGIAYHIGYLPASIRQRIEELFGDGKIMALFCTSTLIEGVNLPADNLFITNYRSGLSKMTSVEFRNLIGRVGRIRFNLHGNVFFVSDGARVKEKEYMSLLKEPIKDQKLSVAQDLKPKLKRHVVETFLRGESIIEPYETGGGSRQPEEEYRMTRKFGLILLRDIMDDRDSLVRREFARYMPQGGEEDIRQRFEGRRDFIDHDINVSADQTKRLAASIRGGLCYPELEEGKFKYSDVLVFLEELSKIFDWNRYESKTLGRTDSHGKHAMLGWYAVILTQWMEGHGLNYIMTRAIRHMEDNPDRFWIDSHTPAHYDGSPEHKNIVFADTLEVIDNIILFSISNYFLRFSNMYKSIYGENSLDANNWYEFVEYGTTNSLTVFLQRNGFSRESANYIKDNPKYLKSTDEGWKLLRTLLQCPNYGARDEAAIIDKNRPGLLIDETTHASV